MDGGDYSWSPTAGPDRAARAGLPNNTEAGHRASRILDGAQRLSDEIASAFRQPFGALVKFRLSLIHFAGTSE